MYQTRKNICFQQKTPNLWLDFVVAPAQIQTISYGDLLALLAGVTEYLTAGA
jgi:hypothetical protein